jgi:hypothetical protein
MTEWSRTLCAHDLEPIMSLGGRNPGKLIRDRQLRHLRFIGFLLVCLGHHFLNSVVFTLLSYLSLNISAPGVAYISDWLDDNRGWLFILSQCFQNCPDKISLVVRAFASADDLPWHTAANKIDGSI